MVFVGEPHRDAVPIKRPQLLDQSVLRLPVQLAGQELNDLVAAGHKLRPGASANRACQREQPFFGGGSTTAGRKRFVTCLSNWFLPARDLSTNWDSGTGEQANIASFEEFAATAAA